MVFWAVSTAIGPAQGRAQLAGAYSIGGVSPSFPTFTAAVSALRQSGISASVVFDVRPGTYTEQVELPQVAGASPVDTILFRSENGNAASVVLQFASTTGTDNHVLRLNGTDHVRFEHMTFSSSTFGAGFRRGVVLKGEVDDVRFEGDVFLGYVNNVSDPDLFAAADTLSGVVLADNTFIGGSWAVQLKGVSALPAAGVRVSGNTISAVQNGIQLNVHRAPVVANNTVAAFNEGISLNSCDGPLSVHANRVDVHIVAGISLTDCAGTAADHALVVNNFIVDREIANGLYSFSSHHVDFAHNSVLGAGSSITGSPFYEAGGASQAIEVENNLFINTGTGYAYYAAAPAGISVSDDNDLLTNGNNVARWGGVDQSDLLVLQGISGKDQHSISRPVSFASSSDLHLVGSSLGDAHLRGTPLVAVNTDIDGEPRSASSPYMGADEVGGWPLAVAPDWVAAGLKLLPPAPNPARSGSVLAFDLPRAGRVRLAVFDAGGRRMRTLLDAVLDAGPHVAPWDGRDDAQQRLAPGAYFCVLDALHARASRGVVVLR